MWPLLLALVAVVAVMGMGGKKKPGPGLNDTPGSKTNGSPIVITGPAAVPIIRKTVQEYKESSVLDVCREFYEVKLERAGIRGFSAPISGNDYEDIYENYLVRWRSGGKTDSPAAAPGLPGGCPESLISPSISHPPDYSGEFDWYPAWKASKTAAPKNITYI